MRRVWLFLLVHVPKRRGTYGCLLISFESSWLATDLASINRTSYLKVLVEITGRETRL